MSKARLRKVGGSVMLPVPPAILRLANLDAGAAVEITVNAGVLEVKAAQPSYTMDELLAASDYSRVPKDSEWLDTQSAGSELL